MISFFVTWDATREVGLSKGTRLIACSGSGDEFVFVTRNAAARGVGLGEKYWSLPHFDISFWLHGTPRAGSNR